MSKRSLLQLRLCAADALCTTNRPSGLAPMSGCWYRAEGDDEAQGARGMDFSSIADPFGDQESGGSSNRNQSDRQDSHDEHGGLQHLRHGIARQSGHQDEAEDDYDDGQTMLFLKVTAWG
jgi:hypothetical protein